MINKLAGLWETKRWLFWLLLPLTALAVGIKYYLDYLEYKADRDLEEAQNRDDELKAKQDKYNDEANKAKAEADKIEEKIENRKTDDIDDDWHLKE